jgi:hypothetical protein
MCLECGFYKGRQVMDLKTQKDKRDARMQAKREAIRAQVASAAAEVSSAATPSEEKK